MIFLPISRSFICHVICFVPKKKSNVGVAPYSSAGKKSGGFRGAKEIASTHICGVKTMKPKVAKWRYERGFRSLADNLLKAGGEEVKGGGATAPPG